MELFAHSASGQVPALIEVEETMTVREVLSVFGSDQEGFWIEDTEEELDVEVTLAEAGVHDRHHVHHHRCRRVEVVVRHIDEERRHEFSPATTVGRVLIWALGPEGFNIPVEQRPEYGFLGCSDGKAVPNDAHVGSLTGPGTGCEACLSLVRKHNPQG
jgi:hypothetical protein